MLKHTKPDFRAYKSSIQSSSPDIIPKDCKMCAYPSPPCQIGCSFKVILQNFSLPFFQFSFFNTMFGYQTI